MSDEPDTDPRTDARTAAKTVELQTYYADARTWAEDREADQARSLRRVWIIAAIAIALALLEALALIALAPLKTVKPYTVLVDRTTGFTQTLDGTHPETMKPQSALVQAMLAQYVVAHESFDIASTAGRYSKVALWSAEAARNDYLALMPTNNPQSPLNLYPRSAVVSTSIESVSMGAPGEAQVRFMTERRDSEQSAAIRSYYSAQLRYRFSGEPMAMEDRLSNPLGFQVTLFRRDQEAMPQTVEPAPSLAPYNPGTVATPIGPRGMTAQPSQTFQPAQPAQPAHPGTM